MTTTTTAGAPAPAGGRQLPPLPAGVLVGWFEPGSPEWHAARANGIGGSEISAVIGLSPFESAFSLWHRKRGLILPVQESEEMYWGKVHESGICAHYAKQHPDQHVIPAGTYHGTGRPWQIVNPDRFSINRATGEVIVIEAKTSRDAEGWGEPGTDEVPVYYRAQVRWYLNALALRRSVIPVLISGSEYREYVIEADDADAELMLTRGEEFIRSVQDGTRPAIDGHTATYRAIKEIPDALDDIDIEIDPELRDRYWAALDACKEAETEKRHAAGLVLDEIGTGKRAVTGRTKVATRSTKADGSTHALQPARSREITP
jgi:putative phage-type endonuclease